MLYSQVIYQSPITCRSVSICVHASSFTDLLQGIHSPKGNFAGDYEAQPVLRSSSFPETLHVSGDVSERKELDSQEFRRQYAKRGKKFYRGSHQEWIGSQGEDGGGSGIDHVDGEVQQIPVVPKLLATAGKHHSLARCVNQHTEVHVL